MGLLPLIKGIAESTTTRKPEKKKKKKPKKGKAGNGWFFYYSWSLANTFTPVLDRLHNCLFHHLGIDAFYLFFILQNFANFSLVGKEKIKEKYIVYSLY